MKSLRKALSYIFPLRLLSTYSEDGTLIKVLLSKGQLKMIFGQFLYSFGLHYYPFSMAFRTLGHDKVQPCQKILILGAGLGSIVQILEQYYQNRYRNYTLVDIDNEVLSICQYYLEEENPSALCQYYQIDGIRFMSESIGQFDMICVDIFIDTEPPIEITEVSFIRNCYVALEKDGVLIMNTHFIQNSNFDTLEKSLNQIFGNYLKLNSRKNRLYIAKR